MFSNPKSRRIGDGLWFEVGVLQYAFWDSSRRFSSTLQLASVYLIGIKSVGVKRAENSRFSAKQRSYFVPLIVGTIHLSGHQRKGSFEMRMFDCCGGVGWREVDMLIYANILESETHLVGLEIRINDQQS